MSPRARFCRWVRSWYRFVFVEGLGYRRPLQVTRVTDAERALMAWGDSETRKIRAALRLLDAETDVFRRTQ